MISYIVMFFIHTIIKEIDFKYLLKAVATPINSRIQMVIYFKDIKSLNKCL